MKAIIAWWNLDNSVQTIDTLRHALKKEGTEAWEILPGLQFKLWISDPINNLWGAVMLWKNREAMTQPLPPNRATELIGYPPTLRVAFDIEATAKID